MMESHNIDGVDAPNIDFDDTGNVERRYILVIISSFFGVFLGWSAFIPLDSAAIAGAKVIVADNIRAIQHTIGGEVSNIYVREGDLVSKGQPLLALDSARISVDENVLTKRYISSIAERQRLLAERDGLPELSQPIEHRTFSPQELAIAKQEIEFQSTLLATRNRSFNTEKEILSKQRSQSANEIAGLSSELKAVRRQLTIATDRLEAMGQLAAKGFASKNQMMELESAVAQLDGREGEIVAAIARVNSEIAENEIELLAVDRKRQSEIAALLDQANTRVDETRPRLIAVRRDVNKLTLRSDTKGRVSKLSVYTTGSVVEPGQLIMEIVPIDQDFLIEAKIAAEYGDDVYLGQEAQVQFLSFKDLALPSVSAEIVSLSPDTQIDQQTGHPYYRAELSVPRTQHAWLENSDAIGPRLQPGLPVQIMIPLRSRSLLDYLVEPLTRMLWRTGREA